MIEVGRPSLQPESRDCLWLRGSKGWDIQVTPADLTRVILADSEAAGGDVCGGEADGWSADSDWTLVIKHVPGSVELTTLRACRAIPRPGRPQGGYAGCAARCGRLPTAWWARTSRVAGLPG